MAFGPGAVPIPPRGKKLTNAHSPLRSEAAERNTCTTSYSIGGALAPSRRRQLLLLALCLLAAGVAALDPGTPRYVVGDILEVDFANQTAQIVIGSWTPRACRARTTHAFLVEQNAGRWEIPRYWHDDLEYTEQSSSRASTPTASPTSTR